MNRNVESHFAELPRVDIPRSRFDRSFGHKTSFNVGELIPFYLEQDVLPGDTFQVKTSAVVRLQTLLTPIMDNMYMDTYYFFVPYRLIWDHTKEFFGEASDNAWLPTTEYQIPVILPPGQTDEAEDVGWDFGTIADYLGVPPKSGVIDSQFCPSALPFRAYALIANEWFRDQNLQDPLYIPRDDNIVDGSNGSTFVTDVAKGGKPFKVAKYHDYFTSCLPAPQRGPEVNIFTASRPVGDLTFNYLPVFSGINRLPENHVGTVGLQGYTFTGDPVVANEKTVFNASNGTLVSQASSSNPEWVPSNLWADLNVASLTINELRLSFQVQKYYEKSARSGSRYREFIKGFFGVNSPDARMMIPEYLGGHRFPLSIHQVANQAQGESDFLGDLGAMSNSSDVHDDFIKSFTEHGIVMGLCCVRYDHSYSQGLNKGWLRRSKFDFYNPVFANLGEQPVKNAEIYWTGGDIGGTFGYQEAWADYRYHPNVVSGEMRPAAPASLASWHLGDFYETTPALSASWIQEDPSNVDRVLAVSSAVSNQVFCDFYIQNYATRPMPMYSIPGLIDHH